MTFTVLSDLDVKKVLTALELPDVENVLEALNQALISYSCGNEQQYQPHRSVVTREGQVSLFMPATTRDLVGVKTVGVSPSIDPKDLPPGKVPPPGLKSALTLCDASGQAIGILNAAELTAFRTSLGPMLIFQKRENVENIVVFGAGKQALWHIWLAVKLRGKDIRKITVGNRSLPRLQELIQQCKTEFKSGWPSHIELVPFETEKAVGSDMENFIAEADVIFCTTPSTKPLFPASFLLSERALQKTRFISAIGSYRLDMQEIDPEFLKKISDPSSELAATSHRGGIVTVDSREGCLQEAGELVAAKIDPSKMVEVGTLFDDLGKSDSRDLSNWLESGLVVYKSVGTGVMDLAVGRYLLDFARSRNIGLSVDEF